MIRITQIICKSVRTAILRSTLLLLAHVLLLAGNITHASDITVVLGPQSGPYQRFLKNFRSELKKYTAGSFNIRVLDAASLKPDDLDNAGDMIIAVGRHAAKKINLSHVTTAVLYSFLPDYIYREIITTGSEQCKKFNCSAIYMDQPVARQIALIKVVLPEIKSVGVLLGDYSAGRKDELLRAGRQLGVEIKIERISSIVRFTSQYERLLERTDAILAMPDPGVYNRSTIKNILLTSDRYRKPVFGFSHAYVNAGAIAAVFSTPEDIARQTADVVTEYVSSQGAVLAGPQYSLYYNIASNQRVARSLGLRPAGEQILRTDMEEILHE